MVKKIKQKYDVFQMRQCMPLNEVCFVKIGIFNFFFRKFEQVPAEFLILFPQAIEILRYL